MITKLASILVGPIVNSITDVWKENINKEISETEVKGQVAIAVTNALANIPDAQAKVLIADAKGETWIQKTWRPLTAASFGFTIFWYAWAGPQLNAWFGLPIGNPGDTLLQWVFDALMVFGSVYAGGRTLEKITDTVVGRIGR